MNDKKIILVDGNNFFASCEQMINPSLKGKAVCVLSNNDGCVIARSNEAKKMGIKMGMPYFMAKKSFPEAVYLSSNFSLYHEISTRMMTLLSKYSDKVDIYSIDEAFLDITGSDKIFKIDYKTLTALIKNDIETHIGITVSIGLASTKILAKLANHKAKKGIGIYEIQNNLILNELENIEVEEIWGIGRNLARSLRKYGIFYAHEILLKDDNFYKTLFGKKGLELKYELSGRSVIPLNGVMEKPKSIQKTRAFPEFSKDKEYIKTELSIHLHNVCKKLRAYNLEADSLCVMLRTKDFRVYYREINLETPTNSEFNLMSKVLNLFNTMYKENVIYRSSGVLVFGLQDSNTVQLSLLTDRLQNKNQKISLLMDKIENKYGKGAISIGKTGIKNEITKHIRELRKLPF